MDRNYFDLKKSGGACAASHFWRVALLGATGAFGVGALRAIGSSVVAHTAVYGGQKHGFRPSNARLVFCRRAFDML